MQLLEVFTPEIETFVRYKVLDPVDVEIFVESHKHVSREEYVRMVLELVVFNLRSEVTDILRSFEKDQAKDIVTKIYNGCVMLNPGLDVDEWLKITNYSTKAKAPVKKETPTHDEFPPHPSQEAEPKPKKKVTRKKVSKAKFLGLESYLKENIVGQNEAVESVVGSLKRSITGLSDEERPLGVFLFAGASGVGKTQLAKELHSYLYGAEFDMVRIDCGEYQHKHENQKLIGSPPGYGGHDEGGYLTGQMKKSRHTVVLLDEVEKAHPDIWNTFLRVFDEGMLTESSGKEISFRDAIIVMTTNLGNREAVADMLGGGTGFGSRVNVSPKDAEAPERTIVEKYTNKAIRSHFRPEFLNRIDKIVVFNHLEKKDLNRIAELELTKLENKLSKRGMRLTYDDNTVEEMVATGVNPVEGARGLSRVRREKIEDVISDTLLGSTRWPRGTVLSLSFEDGEYKVHAKRPTRKKTKTTK